MPITGETVATCSDGEIRFTVFIFSNKAILELNLTGENLGLLLTDIFILAKKIIKDTILLHFTFRVIGPAMEHLSNFGAFKNS